MFCVTSIHVNDNARFPIDGFRYIVRQNGVEIDKGTTGPDGLIGLYQVYDSDASFNAQKKDVDKKFGYAKRVIIMKGDSPIEVLTITDAKQIKLIHSFKPQWGKRQAIIATSDWLKVRLPLRTNRLSPKGPLDATVKEEEEFRKQQCGFATVISEVGTAGTSNFARTTVSICDLPKKIIDTAMKYRGSTEWAAVADKVSAPHPVHGTRFFKSGTDKCSLFVNDVLTEVGIAPPWIEYGWKSRLNPWGMKLSPPIAADWMNPKKLTKNWNSFGHPLPGDIGGYIADFNFASGHVGFIVAPGVVISAGTHSILVNDVGFRENDPTHEFRLFRRHKWIKEK